jgi:hypothetical protein
MIPEPVIVADPIPVIREIIEGPVQPQQPIPPADLLETQQRLQLHKMVLEAMDVTDLSNLGKLFLNGAVVPQPGLLTPPSRPSISIVEGPTVFQSAFRRKPGSKPVERVKDGRHILTQEMERIGGQAYLLKAKPFRQRRFLPIPGTGSRIFLSSTIMPLSVAYWAATEIDIADNTTIIFQKPNRWLVIIAEKITVGHNVTLTWEQEEKEIPTKPKKARRGSNAKTPDGLWGVTGGNGKDGTHGGRSPDGDDGPEIEIWTLDMSGHPEFHLDGQDGFRGGEGGDGGDGGTGSKGKDWVPAWGFPAIDDCASGPGSGGKGGKGGRAGDGGPGGDGGHGGRFSLYAPETTILAYAAAFTILPQGGEGGEGGNPGTPGKAGEGGKMGLDKNSTYDIFGNKRNRCPTSRTVADGQRGDPGDPGNRGLNGNPGGHYEEGAVRLRPITKDEFARALLRPTITWLSASTVKEGDTVTVHGRRFTETDVVLVNGVKCTTNILSDTLLTFVVPAVEGGRQKPVVVKQTDGTLSNPYEILIETTLSHVEQNGQSSLDISSACFVPGTRITLVGSGFAPDAQIRVSDVHVYGSDVQFHDAQHLSFTLIRPTSPLHAPEGEPVEVQVILADGTKSNSITIVLDAFRMVVLGDSIQWGQGLAEHLKLHSLVEEHIRTTHSNIGVYKTVLAHSGAIIGSDDNTQQPPIHGEVPTDYPTILQQVDAYDGNPKAVDLVLMDGGINDVYVVDIVNPFSTVDLAAKVRQNCYTDMKELLEKVTTRFSNAKVIVTGYYQIASDNSDITLLEAFLVAFGGLVAGALTVAAKNVVVERCRIFATESTEKLKQAVNETNSNLDGEPRVFFADPKFTEANAIFASEPLIYGVNADLSPQDSPPTGVAPHRAPQCDAAASRTESVAICKRASMGHPNVAGAQKYADAIMELGVL